MTSNSHTIIWLSTKFCTITTNGMPNETMKVNTLFTFLAPQQIQACVKAELLSQIQLNYIQARSSPKISPNMFATTCLEGENGVERHG